MNQELEYLTVGEYALRYRICEKTVRRWIAEGHVYAVRLGTGSTIRIPVPQP